MAWQKLMDSIELASLSGDGIIESEHLMKCILKKDSHLVEKVLMKIENPIELTRVEQYTDEFMSRHKLEVASDFPRIGPHLDLLVKKAAKKKQSTLLSVVDLLRAFSSDDRFGKQLLDAIQVEKKEWKKAILVASKQQSAVKVDTKVLERNGGRDLTSLASRGKLDPVVGREEEIQRCIALLGRRTKSNPIIIGEAGVGKSAIVEGLAQRIVSGNVPDYLLNKKIVSLNMMSLISGTMYRGDMEKRLNSILETVIASEGYIILFIDEIHTIMGAGATEGSEAMNMSNLLKPILARRDFCLIGATTPMEYRRYIEQDAALARRFQRVFCGESSVQDTITILRALRERIEAEHPVKISDKALVAAAELTERYITDRSLPDKAIDLIDEVAAKMKSEFQSKPPELVAIETKILSLETELSNDEGPSNRDEMKRELKSLKKMQIEIMQQWQYEKSLVSSIQLIKEEVNDAILEMKDAEEKFDLDAAITLKCVKLKNIQHRLDMAEKRLVMALTSFKFMVAVEVTETEVASLLSNYTGIPMEKLQQSEKGLLSMIEVELGKKVFVQKKAVKSVANAIIRSRTGVSDPSRPIASFLFVGPSGVGKTQLAKALASCLFNTETALVRVNMNEYIGEGSVTRLIGALPGGIGYREGGELTEMVRRRPYSVVLFDEIEKAEPRVRNVLLNLLDEGKIRDSSGRMVDFTNCVMIMTSNVGAEIVLKSTESYHSKESEIYDEIEELVRKEFSSEFVNRLDNLIVFASLEPEEIDEVVDIQLNKLKDRLGQRNINLRFTKEVVHHLGMLSYHPNSGGRKVRGIVLEHVGDPIARGVLYNKITKEVSIDLAVGQKTLIFQTK